MHKEYPLYTSIGYYDYFMCLLQEGVPDPKAWKLTEKELRSRYPGMIKHESYDGFKAAKARYVEDLRKRTIARRKAPNHVTTSVPPLYTYVGYMLRFFIHLNNCSTQKEAYLKTEEELQSKYPGLFRYNSYDSFRNAIKILKQKV